MRHDLNVNCFAISGWTQVSFFIFFLLLVNSRVLAIDIYVDAGAPAGGNGSRESPFRVLQRGVDAARPGDSVRVRAGTYDAIRTRLDGTPTQPISIAAENSRTAIIQANGRALDIQHSHHRFQGLVFDSAYGPRQVVRARRVSNLQFKDVEVRRGTRNCIVLSSVRQVLITDSSIHHCINEFDPKSNADAHGVTGGSVFGLTIKNTEIYMVTGDALQLSPSREPWDQIYIEGSRLWSGILDESVNGWEAGKPIGENAIDTKVGPSVLNGSGQRPQLRVVDTIAYGWRDVIGNQGAFLIKENVDAVLDRVTVYDSELGFRLRFPAKVRVQNAVVYDVDHAFRLEGGLRNPQILNVTLGGDIEKRPIRFAGGNPQNLIVKNLLFLGEDLPAQAKNDSSNMAVDLESFVNPEKHDYRIRASSLAIDSGDILDGVKWDREGQPRPYGKGYDIGAYEWTDFTRSD